MGRSWRALAERTLGARRPPLHQLLDALDLVNPTPHEVGDSEREERYRLKAALQSRLIELHGPALALRRDGELWVLSVAVGGRDAKHVVVSQLTDAARDWAHLHGEGNESPPDDVSAAPVDRPGNAPPSPGWAASVDALLEQGAIEEAATLALSQVGRAGPYAACRALEIALEWLDSPQWALAAELPDAALRSDEVMGWRALALARCDRLEEGVRCLGDRSSTTVGRAWLELGQRALRAGRDDLAARAADGICHTAPALRDRAETLRTEVLNHRRIRHADLEGAARAAVERGDWASAGVFAGELARRVPGSPVAREVAREVALHRERERRESVRRAAEQASRSGSHADAARWFDEAAALGDPDGAERAREARAAARSAEVLRDATDLEALLRTRPAAGLRKWLDAPEEVRSRIAARPELVWLDRIARHRCGPRRGWAELALLAVRVETAPDPEGAFRIAPARSELEKIPEWLELVSGLHERWVEEGAEALRETLAALRAEMPPRRDPEEELEDDALRTLLATMTQLLERLGRLDSNRVPPDLQTEFHEVATEAAARATELARIVTYEAAIIQDPLDARRIARAHGWVVRERRAARAVAERYQFRRFEGDGTVPDLMFDRLPPSETPRWLDHTGTRVRIAEFGERWVVLRELEVSDGRCVVTLTFRAPWTWSPVRVESDAADGVWLVDITGHAAHLVDGELVDLVDLGTGAMAGRVSAFGDRLLVAPRREPTERFPAPTARHVLWDPVRRETSDLVRWVVVEPLRGSPDLIGLRPDGTIERIGEDGSTRRLGSAGALGEPLVDPLDPERVLMFCTEAKPGGRLMLARSTQQGEPVEPVLWLDGFDSTERLGLGVGNGGWVYLLGRRRTGERQLAGVRIGSTAGWTFEMPGWATLVTDAEGRRCSLLLDLADGVAVFSPGAAPPDLPPSDPDDALPALLDTQCSEQKGRAAELADDLRRSAVPAERVKQLLEQFGDRPADRMHLFRAAVSHRVELGDAVARTDPLVLVDAEARLHLLETAVLELELERASSLAEELARELLPRALAAHRRHLHALVHLWLGRRQAAQELVRAALAEPDPRCPLEALDRWMRWMDESDPNSQPTSREGRWWFEVRAALREVSDARDRGDTAGAWRASRRRILGRCPVAAVVSARAAAALAHPEAPWVERLVAILRLWRHARSGAAHPLDAGCCQADEAREDELWRAAARFLRAPPDG